MSQTKKALIVSPYLDHLGGGERYMLSVASVLETLGYQISFGWDNLSDITHLAQMLGISLHAPILAPAIRKLYRNHNPLAMFQATHPYDVVVYLSDGSIPLLGGKKNIIHMQVPFHNVGGKSLKNQLKKLFIHRVIVNSQFTKKIVDHEYGLNSLVVYPPVDITGPSMAKTKTILSVGRFEPSLNTKKHDIMIQAFKQITQELPGWKLVLAGASASDSWVSQLKKTAGNVPIEFAINISHDELNQLYKKSRLYWHAAGYGVDPKKNPELTEHFGITTAEAIGNGCIPLIYPAGGQTEIVTDDSLYWTSIDELCQKTLHLVQNDFYTFSVPELSIVRYSPIEFQKAIQSLL